MALVLLDNEKWDFGSNCFVCEPKNGRGLGIPFYLDAEANRVVAPFTPETHHSGAPMFAHGGFSQALLDEGMAWAVIAIAHRFGMTRRSEVTFVRPVKLGQPHTTAAWIESRDGHDLIALGDHHPNLLRRRTIGRVFSFSADCFLGRSSGDQRRARFVIDDLGVDMLAGKIDAKTWTFRGAGNLSPDAVVNSSANDFSINRRHGY